jgi:hypothetical protein
MMLVMMVVVVRWVAVVVALAVEVAVAVVVAVARVRAVVVLRGVVSAVAMTATVSSAVRTRAVASAAVAAAVVAAMLGSCGSGSGGVGGSCGGMTVTPVASPFVAPTAHLEMESCHNTQGASFKHARKQLICFSCPIFIWLGNYKMQYKHVKTLDNPVVLLAGVRPTFCSPNGPLLVESIYQSITYYIFQIHV